VIGGDDQIAWCRAPDAGLRANQKPFFGIPTTQPAALPVCAGIVGFHGGSTMVHLGRGGWTHPVTMTSLRAALFRPGWFELTVPAEFSDEALDWNDPESLNTEPVPRPAPGGWIWHQPSGVVEAPTWGGNLEIVGWLLMADRAAPTPDEIDGHVLLLETSEECPAPVFRRCTTW
jgi:muramoyltetrapeptide carboxypeptidase LdcA involved in peptidoglycan recycling